MVRKALGLITTKVGGLHKAAFWLSGFSLVSLMLGFLRDRILAHYFGAGIELDIYYAAFKVPDLIFATVASLASASILIPLFNEKANSNEKLQNSINSIFSSFSLILVAISVIGYFLMPYLIEIFFDYSGQSYSSVLLYSRVMLLSPFFLGLSNFFGAILQYERRFILYALSPLFYNGGIIAGLLLGAESYGIVSAVIGVSFGAFLHMFIPALFVFSSPESPRWTSNIFNSDSRRTFLLSVPRTLSLSVSSIVMLLLVSLASRLELGSIAVFTLAFNLQSVLLSLIGSSYSLAAFPTLAEHYSRNELSSLAQCLGDGLRHIIFWSLPLTGLFIVLRAHIVRVVLGSGAFNWDDTRMTAAVLSLFVVTVVFQSLQLFLTRAQYAFGNTKTPLIINVIGGSVTAIIAIVAINNIAVLDSLSALLASMLKVSDLDRTGVLVLPLAFSVGAIISATLLWWSVSGEIRRATESIRSSIRDAILATAVSSFATLIMLRMITSWFELDSLLNVLIHGGLSGVFGILCGTLVLYLLNNREIMEVSSKVFKR